MENFVLSKNLKIHIKYKCKLKLICLMALKSLIAIKLFSYIYNIPKLEHYYRFIHSINVEVIVLLTLKIYQVIPIYI